MTASVRSVATKKVAPTLVRCAIYTRKSSEEGLEQEFNSLDAQRESGEAYITSMKHEGWMCLPDRYDDGGYTGGNTERPALKKLLKDIDAGRVDTVVVYKVDRLSRSLLDFSRMMETFERRHVSFVSVTQQFNTTQSMGRLTLNILLSFAQFERELVSERTRDKIAAARRKGKWSGGRPILGYDIVKGKLVVNEAEAQRVREIFELYIANESLIRTARELNGREWRTKQWTSAAGATMGGAVWDKVRLWHLLVNVAYLGKVRHHAEVYPGEHSAIIEESLFRRAQEVLVHNGRTSGSEVRNIHGAILKSLLHCARCKRLMGHVFTSKKTTQYRYYKCHAAQKGGVAVCPLGCIPAEQVESFVVEQLRRVQAPRRIGRKRSPSVPRTRRHGQADREARGRCRGAGRRWAVRLRRPGGRVKLPPATDGRATPRRGPTGRKTVPGRRRRGLVRPWPGAGRRGYAGDTASQRELERQLDRLIDHFPGCACALQVMLDLTEPGADRGERDTRRANLIIDALNHLLAHLSRVYGDAPSALRFTRW